MFGSEILEVAIGIVFIYWLLSLMCSALNEMISWASSMRAKDLEKGIRNLLNDPKGTGDAKEFYDHSLIKALKKGDRNPSYIPARTFALVLKDIIAKGDSRLKGIGEMRNVVDKIPNKKLKESLLVLVNDAGSQLNKVQENVENWFNDMMDRVSGWYKRKVQRIIALLALGVVVLFNADTFMIVKNLLYNAPVRAAIVAKTEKLLKQQPELASQNATNKPESSVTTIKNLQKDLLTLPLPLGWSELPKGILNWLIKILGLLFTAIAVSLGAPFWFEFLEKILKIRIAQAGKRPVSTS